VGSGEWGGKNFYHEKHEKTQKEKEESRKGAEEREERKGLASLGCANLVSWGMPTKLVGVCQPS